MKLGEAINKIIKDSKKTHATVAEMIGRASGSAIGNAVVRNNLNVKTLLDITDALGYEMILKPKNGENKAERTIKIDSERVDK